MAGWPGDGAITVTDVRRAFSTAQPAASDADLPATRTVPAELPSADDRPAAVLCAVFDDAGRAAVVLTRRSTQMRSHTGEVALPGGHLEPQESPAAAALREAWEEVGIDAGSVEMIGQLRPLATYARSATVMPFVGLLASPPKLQPNPSEVDRAFTVTLSELVAPGVYHDELWPDPRGAERPIHFFDLVGETVWGATARILRDLLDRTWVVALSL
ncbi:MAG: NUDIX hydrolase [Acidimicrobiales bacterium]